MSQYSKSIQPIVIRRINISRRIVILILLPFLLASGVAAANPWSAPDSLLPNITPTCSEQAENFFFITPYAARTDTNPGGGTVQEVADDGFTALGLSFQTGENLESEFIEWLRNGN